MKMEAPIACWLAVFALVATSAARAQTCVGDCNGDGMVAINELITGVDIALGSAPISACPSFNCGNTDPGTVPIHCLIQGVDNALGGCPATDGTVDLTGSWAAVDVDVNGGHFSATWTLVQSGTSISGTDSANGGMFTGSISGHQVTLSYVCCATYTANFSLTVAPDGTSITGTWSDSNGDSGTSTLSR